MDDGLCVIHMYVVCMLFYLIVQYGIEGAVLITLYINGHTEELIMIFVFY